MRLFRSVSVSTLVALAIAGFTAIAVTISLLGSGQRTPDSEALTDRASDLLIHRAGDSLIEEGREVIEEGRGAIEEVIPVSTDGLVALRGSIGLADDQPVAGATAATRPRVPNECPVMTDSIRRLYLGFLEREPTADELGREINRYRSGEANLEALADVLAGSGRFQTEYGPLADRQYIERVYANTIGGEPDEAEFDHWTTSLANGYGRGAVMLAFTESAEFVRRTGTARPLSGYLTWYPDGTHWYCGVGPRDDLPVRPLTGGAVYADYLFINSGNQDEATALTTVLDGRQRVMMAAAEVPSGFTDYRWDGLFVGADNYGDAIDVVAGAETGWVVVFYPNSVGRQRLGWHVPW